MLSALVLSVSLVLHLSSAVPIHPPKHKLRESAKEVASRISDSSCQNEYCSDEAAACFEDISCAAELACSGACSAYWPLDRDPAKLRAQNCTLKCSQTFLDDITDDYMTCMFDNNCINDQESTNITCPDKLFAENVQSNASMASWSGDWWIHKGWNPVYDCSYPCQATHNVRKMDDNDWNYTFSFLESTITNELKYYVQTLIMPDTNPGKPVDFSYQYLGTYHNESWYPIEATDRYIVHVDCSYFENWVVQGGMLWVRPDVSLTQSEEDSIADAFAKVGYNYPNDFCDVHYQGNCPY